MELQTGEPPIYIAGRPELLVVTWTCNWRFGVGSSLVARAPHLQGLCKFGKCQSWVNLQFDYSVSIEIRRIAWYGKTGTFGVWSVDNGSLCFLITKLSLSRSLPSGACTKPTSIPSHREHPASSAPISGSQHDSSRATMTRTFWSSSRWEDRWTEIRAVISLCLVEKLTF